MLNKASDSGSRGFMVLNSLSVCQRELFTSQSWTLDTKLIACERIQRSNLTHKTLLSPVSACRGTHTPFVIPLSLSASLGLCLCHAFSHSTLPSARSRTTTSDTSTLMLNALSEEGAPSCQSLFLLLKNVFALRDCDEDTREFYHFHHSVKTGDDKAVRPQP